MRVDLHLHTTASDGQLTPTQVVDLAHRRGVHIIAITDHDTTQGIAEAITVARQFTPGVLPSSTPQIVPGIELSAEDDSGDVHMLGYFLQLDLPSLQQQLAEFRADRAERGERMVQRLQQMGIPLQWQRVVSIANGAAIGRPHIARALMEAKVVRSVSEAFELYIGNDGPAYVARRRLSPEEAIRLIHAAGGVAVLAHPGLLPYAEGMIQRLLPTGLDGVEIFHPSNPAPLRATLKALAARHQLVGTGGSDFHGLGGNRHGDIGIEPVTEVVVQQLYERARRYQPS